MNKRVKLEKSKNENIKLYSNAINYKMKKNNSLNYWIIDPVLDAAYLFA